MIRPMKGSSFTAKELKQFHPTKIDKMEQSILKMLSGWSVIDIECVLIHRVLPEVKRKATFK